MGLGFLLDVRITAQMQKLSRENHGKWRDCHKKMMPSFDCVLISLPGFFWIFFSLWIFKLLGISSVYNQQK